MSACYIGTSGFSVQDYYPDSLPSSQRLSYYAERFNTVEINSTFYHMPRVATIEHWCDTVPSTFVFSFKVFRPITQALNHNFPDELLQKWFEQFKALERSNNQHVMLFQFPASLQKNIDHLKHLLTQIPDAFVYAFEFRHPTWFDDDVYRLLKKRDAAVVLADNPKKSNGASLWPMVDQDTGHLTYIRFHGSPDLYASSYSQSELQDYAQLISEKLKQGKRVFSYFNNDARAASIRNAQTLQALLKE